MCVSDTQADHSVRALYTLIVLSCGVSTQRSLPRTQSESLQMSADFIFEKKCTVWMQIRIELATFLIIRYLIIFDELSLSNYPLTNSQFFNLNMQILWTRVLKEWSQ